LARGVVHWYGNIFNHVPSTKVREIAAMLKAIHASEDIVAAREKTIHERRLRSKSCALRSPPEPVPGAAESNCKQRRKPSQEPPRSEAIRQ
jgi:hypothetical protein